MRNNIVFKLTGKHALFTDPLTRMGGEKFSYHVPTYEAIKGVVKSVYWKPTIIWIVDRIKVMKRIRTQSKGMKLIKYHEKGNELSIYTYLTDVEYQVEAHFEWNMHRPELAKDRIDGKHFEIVKRMLEKGGRQDIFLGARECQGYVEPCTFDEGPSGDFADLDELSFGLMFHGFDYPDESGVNELRARFWYPVMRHGIIEFSRPEQCPVLKSIAPMTPKKFNCGENHRTVEEEYSELD